MDINPKWLMLVLTGISALFGAGGVWALSNYRLKVIENGLKDKQDIKMCHIEHTHIGEVLSEIKNDGKETMRSISAVHRRIDDLVKANGG